MRKASKYDPFDLKTCLEGLGTWLLYADSDLYEFSYFITFNREMRSYIKTFKEPYEKPVDIDFLKTVNDPIVRHCLYIQELLNTYYVGYYFEMV